MNTLQCLTLLARASAQAGLLVLLVLAARWIFKERLTPRWRCALWLLVVLRLLLPFSAASMLSLFNLLPKWSLPAPKEIQVAKVAPRPLTPLPAAPVAIHEVSPAARANSAALSPAPPSIVQPRAAASAVEPAAAQPPMALLSHPFQVNWPKLLFWIWLAGALGSAVYLLAGACWLALRRSRLRAVEDPAVLDVLRECQERMGVRRPLRVVRCDVVQGPALFGLFHPSLLLPGGLTHRFSAQELRFIFLHELAHVRRKDLWLNWLAALLQALHWFNPLVWVGFAQWRTDRETACDALALEVAGAGQNQDYGRTILRLVEELTHRTPLPGTVGILEDKRQLRRRIGLIASFRPGKRLGFASVALFCALAVAALTDAQTPKPSPSRPAAARATGAPAAATNAAPNVRIGQDPPLSAVTNGSPCELAITVLDANSGQPLAQAEIFAPYTGRWDQRPPQRRTDSQGRYLLRWLAPPEEARREMSHFSVTANLKGYASRTAAWTSSPGDVVSTLPKEATIRLDKGIPIGGVVTDEQGKPLAGIKVLLSGSSYRGFTMGTQQRQTHDYGEVYLTDVTAPAAQTEAAGRWSFAHLPADLQQFEIGLVRPDGSREAYATHKDSPLNHRPLVELSALRSQTARLTLHNGVTVRGVVLDEAGHPLGGVTVKEGYGHGNIERVSEFQTGADGRFERLNRAPRQWIYTASRSDRATVSVVAQVEPGMPEVRLVLPPAKPLAARFVDSAGKPLAGVTLRLDSYRNEGQLLDWSGTSDAEGRVVWTNAPLTPVTIYASSASKPVAMRKFRQAGGEPEKRIVLDPASLEQVKVRVTALDAATHQPVKLRALGARFEGPPDAFKPLGEPEGTGFTATIHRTDFRVGMYPSYQLQLQADGYENAQTKSIDFDLGDQDLALALTPASNASGLAHLPNGRPAAGARLWVRTGRDSQSLFCNQPGRYYGDRLTKIELGEDGKYVLPSAPADSAVVFTHPDGFLETTLGELRRTGQAHLQALGTVEGKLLVGDQPGTDVQVNLSTLLWSPKAGFQLIYTATTRPDGTFTFTQVPPGEYKLYRNLNPRRMGTITESHPMPLVVKPGETLKLVYGGGGRAVIGRAQPQNPDLPVDWLNDIHVLVLKQPPLPPVNREDFASFEAFSEANSASFSSPARLKQTREARTYQLVFQEDGSFRADDVPPGSYELRIRVTKPNPQNRFSHFDREGEELGALVREVEVSKGREPLDLGTLTVPFTASGPGGSARLAPPLDFQAATLQGKPLRLAEQRGKPLLLVFWAAWSERSREAIPELNKIRALSSQNQLTCLAVNLDDEPASARQAASAFTGAWLQAHLEAKARGQVTAAFKVDTLPGVFLLDKTGRITGRNLEGERLRTALTRLLPAK